MSFQPFHHTVVATDVVGSSARDDQLQLKMRHDLRDVLARALARQGIDLALVVPTDLGDGFRLHVPATVSPLAMLSPFVTDLTTELRLHRRSANEASRLRLRMAIHMGLLNREADGGWSGRTLTESARLLDAPAARDLIADASEADLVVVVSDVVFQAVVRQGYGLVPEDFRRIPVVLKESNQHAWALVPGRTAPTGTPVDGQAPPIGEEGVVAAGRSQPKTPAGTGRNASEPVPGVVLGHANAVFLTGGRHRVGSAGQEVTGSDY